MDNIVQLLYSRISHSNKNIAYLDKPPPTFYSVVSKYQQPHTEVWNNYNQIIQEADQQIKRRIINVEKIKQIGSTIYEWLTYDISKLAKYQQHVDKLQILYKSLRACQQKQIKYIGQLKQLYEKVKQQKLKQQQFQQFIKLDFTPYTKLIAQQILPNYQYLVESVQINKIVSGGAHNITVIDKQTHEEQSMKLREILGKVRTIVASEYERWLRAASPRSTQYMQGAINFLVKLKSALAEVDIFICGANCALQKTYYYAEHHSVKFLKLVKVSYHKFIRSSTHGKWMFRYFPNLEYMSGFVCQCYYQIALYIYITKFATIDIDSILQNYNTCLASMNNLLLFNDSSQRIRLQQKLQQLANKTQWYLNFIANNICCIYTEIKDKLDTALIQFEYIDARTKGLSIFYRNSLQQCLGIIWQVNKFIKNIHKQNNISKLNQSYIKLNEFNARLQTIATQLQNNEFDCNQITKIIQIKITQIKQQKQSIGIKIINSEDQENRNSKNQSLLPILSKINKEIENGYLKTTQSENTNLPKLQLQQIELILQDCELYFQVQFKSYLVNGFDLALYQLDKGNAMSKRHQNQGKYMKAKKYMQGLMNKLKFDKSIFNGNKLKRRQSSRSFVKSEDLEEQLGNSKISVSLNRSQFVEIDMKRETDIATSNIKVLLHLLQQDLRQSKGKPMIELAQQCLDFEVQDWAKRIVSFQAQFAVFKHKIKQLQLLTNTNVTYLFSSVYKILKQYIGVLEIVDDILTQILFIFKSCKQMQNQRKGNFFKKHFSIVNTQDLQYLQAILSYKMKMKDEFQQLQKFSNISKSAKIYLANIYSKFNVNFECCYPYGSQILINIIQRMQFAISFKENYKQIFQVFFKKLQQLSLNQKNKNNDQIQGICKEVQNIENEIKKINKLTEMKLPISQIGFEEINRIYLLYNDQFIIAKIICNGNQQLKLPKLSSERKQHLLSKVISQNKAVRQN